MLEYEWGNPPSTIVLTGNEEAAAAVSDQTHRQIFDHYASASHSLLPEHLLHQQQQLGPTHTTTATTTADFSHYHFNHQPLHHHHHHNIHHSFDPRAFPGASSLSSSSYPPLPPPHPAMLSLDPLPAVNATHCGPGGLLVVPKSEDVGRPTYFPASRIGLNLGGRTYFSSEEDDFVSRLYRRSRPAEPGSLTMGSNSPRCQAEGCNADLSNAKHYHRRHKVCEFHSKAATVIAAGLTQRFCQQCSRFHLLSEFDNGKRSCRKRLADHNRRRRKTQQPNQEILKSQLENARNSTFDSVSRSPPDSVAQAMSSVTVAVSPPDYFRQRAYPNQSSSSSATSSSLFFSSG